MRDSGERSGAVVVLEGVDDVGKTTLAKELVAACRSRGIDAAGWSFPGSQPGRLGKLVSDIHAAQSHGTVDPTSLQLMHVAAHIDGIRSPVEPWLRAGKLVVLDRCWWSTWVYGTVGKAHPASLKAMIDIELRHWGTWSPLCVFVVKRGGVPCDDTRMALLREYDALADRERLVYGVDILDNDRSIQEATRRLADRVAELWLISGRIVAPPEPT